MPPVLWKLEPATEAKHRLYKRYLDAWWPIFLQQDWVKRITYVDAFAGPGQYEDGEDGSPVFALDRLLHHEAIGRMNLSRDRVTLIFIEGDEKRYRHLVGLLTEKFGPVEDLPVNVIIKYGRAEVDTLPLLTKTGAWGSPILAVYDSWGNVGVPLTQIARVASNPSSEVVVTFGSNWFSRRESEDPDDLDRVFGGRQFWRPSGLDWKSNERWIFWLETYRSAMLRSGFSYSIPFQVVPGTGQPLELVFGTRNDSGVKAFKEAMWKVDTSNGMRFSDPRTTVAKQDAMRAVQPSLFDEDPDGPDRELLAFVADSLADGPRSLDQIRDFLLRDTARWLPKHAYEAVHCLVEQGRLTRDPPAGRLTKTTTLRLKT